MKRNQWILTGLAAAGVAGLLIRKFKNNKQTSMSSTGNSSKAYGKHRTNVFSKAKNMGSSAMA